MSAWETLLRAGGPRANRARTIAWLLFEQRWAANERSEGFGVGLGWSHAHATQEAIAAHLTKSM